MKDIIYPLGMESLDSRQTYPQLSYILCEITSKTEKSLGILAFVAIDAIRQNRIIPNEKTYPQKQKKILASFKTEKIQKKPMLLAYDKENVDLNNFKQLKPTSVFFSENITYRLWEIKEQEKVQQLSKALNSIGQFIVADGHHRLAAMAQYYQTKNVHSDGLNFLALLVEKSQLILQGYNKLLTSISLPSQKLIELMSTYFDIDREGINRGKPALYLNKTWTCFSLKDKFKTSQNFDSPANYIHVFLFEKLLEINNEVMEEKVISISQDIPLCSLEQMVKNGVYQAAIYIPPMDMRQFINHVKSGCLFPQNTTFFSPKINQDLFLFLIQKQKIVLDLQNSEMYA